MKAENSTDVREWLLYYKWLGVEHVYLTENSYRPTPVMRGQLNDFVSEGFLTYEVDGTKGPQLKLYRRCMEQHYHKHNWLAFLDLDEILVIREQPQMKLPQLLDRYKYEPALSVHWVLVGPSGQHARPASGGVMRHYTHCAGEGSHVIKTIANTFYLSNAAGHAHNAEFRDGRRSVDEKFQQIDPRDGVFVCSAVPPAVSNQTRTPVPYQHGAHFYEDAGASSSRRYIDTVALFHYSTKSQADFAVKIQRGASSGGNPKSWEFFEQLSREARFTGGLCDIPQSLADECCPQDQLVLADPWGKNAKKQ